MMIRLNVWLRLGGPFNQKFLMASDFEHTGHLQYTRVAVTMARGSRLDRRY